MIGPVSNRYRIPILSAAVALGLIIALWLLRQALAPFFLAIVFAYLLLPSVEYLARRMKRGRAVTFVILGALTALAVALRLLLPPLLRQLDRLASSVPSWRTTLETRWGPWLESHLWIRDRLQQGVEGLDPMILVRGLWGAGLDLVAGFLQAMTFLLVPVMVYYLLVEGPRLLQAMDDMVPPRHRDRVRTLAANIHARLGGYIRGQLAVALAMAILQSIAFQIVGIPYPWLFGFIAGISNIVPYSPYLTALLPALIVAGLGEASWGRLLVIATVFTSVQKAETLYFTPVWVGRASRLHPLEVLLAILCFGFAFGIVGLVFAVPLMIVFKVVLEMLVADYKAHPWFEEPEAVLADSDQKAEP